jgi:hypothetical protein
MMKKEMFSENHAPQARVLIERNALQARLMKQNALQDRFFD